MSTVQLRSMGDRAMLAYLADEAHAVAFAKALDAAAFSWLVDVVPAYTSVGVHFDPTQIDLAGVRVVLQGLPFTALAATVGRVWEIPCCYEWHLDLERVAELTHQRMDEVVRWHTSVTYTVYAIGFCPGFPYLGYLPEALCGVPRLPSPRVRLEPGSVGLTGRQTGIYPLGRPGGWNIIGRTPVKLVDVEAGYFPLAVGDRVRFRAIPASDFRDGQPLESCERSPDENVQES